MHLSPTVSANSIASVRARMKLKARVEENENHIGCEDRVAVERGGERKEDEEGSFDPEVDASRRSAGGEEAKGSYRFDLNQTPREIINLAKTYLAANAEKQGDGGRSTSMDEDGTPGNE